MGRLYQAQREIAAPAERTWAVLTDLEGYAGWNPFTPKVESDRVVGHPVLLHVRLPSGRIRLTRETMLRWEPGVELRWGLIWHRRLFAGERWQRIEPLGPARCRYSTGERFVGLFAPLVDALYGGMVQTGFEAVAEALAREAESRV